MAGFVPITVAGQKRSFTAFPTSARKIKVDKKTPVLTRESGKTFESYSSRSPLGESYVRSDIGQVFWLTDHPTRRAFPTRKGQWL